MSQSPSAVLPRYHADQKVTQLRVGRSEATKLWSLPSARWSLLTAALLFIGFGVLFTLLQDSQPPHGVNLATFDPTSSSLSGIYFAELATGVLGVLFITGEYATGQLRATFAAVPRRLPVLWGKAAVLALVTFAVCAPATVASFLIGQSILSAHHLSVSLGHPGAVRAILGTAASVAVTAVLGLGLGTLIRNTAGAIGALFGLLYALSICVSFLPSSVSIHVSKYLPGSTDMDLTSTVRSSTSLSPWTGFGLYCLYAAIALGLAALQLRRQEV
jgi:ABC-2 type transport system permease protein